MNNKEIDEIFITIKTIVDDYLTECYLNAPDPDDVIFNIEQLIKRYRNIQ